MKNIILICLCLYLSLIYYKLDKECNKKEKDELKIIFFTLIGVIVGIFIIYMVLINN